jgi:hypothetical protein
VSWLPLALSALLAANPYVTAAREQYEALDFEKCLVRLSQATQLKSDRADVRDLELYAGLCHLGLNHQAEATEHLKLALRIDERVDLPPYSSPKAVELFLSIKKQLRAPPQPMPDSDLPADAPVERREASATRPPLEPARLSEPAATLKAHAAPLALGGVAVVGLALGAGLALQAQALRNQALATPSQSEYERLAAQARGNQTGANVAFALAATAAVTGVVVWVLQREPTPATTAP